MLHQWCTNAKTEKALGNKCKKMLHRRKSFAGRRVFKTWQANLSALKSMKHKCRVMLAKWRTSALEFGWFQVCVPSSECVCLW